MDHTRHSALFLVPPHFSVTLIGAGGIGATTALVLAKMGVRFMTIYDDDVVSETNIATQLHPSCDIGAPKIESLNRTLQLFSDTIWPVGIEGRVHAGTKLAPCDLMISAVDSITARQEIWEAIQRMNEKPEFYLDARMAAEKFDLFTVQMSDLGACKRYEAMLMNLREDSIEELPCTQKSTFFTASLAAGHAGTQLRNILRGEAKSHRLVHFIPQNQIHEFQL